VKLYLIRQGRNEDIDARIALLRTACESRGVAFHEIDSEEVDYSCLPTLGAGDMLYNATRGSQTLEALLLNPSVASFYRDVLAINWAGSTTEWTLIHEMAELPAPRTIHHIANDRYRLDRYVTAVGGFPLIIKASGGTRGVGVMRVDSRESLYSIVDYLLTVAPGRYMLREYVEATFARRLVVLGSRVIAAVDYFAPEGDFRSSAAQMPHAKAAEPTRAEQDTAVRAVQLLGLELGGVDLLISGTGAHYLLEVNFPFSPQTPQRLTGVDVAGLMVEWLVRKAHLLAREVTEMHQ